MHMLANLGLGNIPSNVILLIEEDMGDVKSVFVQMAAQELLRDMKNVVYISTARSSEDVKNRMYLTTSDDENNESGKNFTIVGSFDDLTSLLYICQKDEKMCTGADRMPDPMLKSILDTDICIIDTFSYLFMEEDTGIIKSAMNSFIAMSRANETTFLLLSDMGILTERSERIIRSMVDGIIQFKTEYIGSKINRYINIPKMQDNPPLNRMIPFNVTARGITIDTRERVG
jgi:KaiC/GvpD/RAD55 family RecA-like ATPase